MPSIAEIKQQYPDLADSSDDQVVDALHQAFYADLPREQIAARLGVKAAAAPVEPSSKMRRLLGDPAVSLVKGAIGVPESAVGLADLVTGGRVGKFLENKDGDVGFRPKEARAALDEYLSPEQQAANAEVQNAHGFVDVAKAAISNPSVIAHSALESLPSMGAGGVVGRGMMALAPKLGGAVAAGAGEGVTTMGQQAESVRQETTDGLLTPGQAALAAGSGALTGAIGVAAGRLAQKLGIENVETLLVGAKADPVAKQSLVRRVVGGAVTEGVLEELPQSVQEQVAQNIALGKPLDEGVDQAAVLGVLTGGAMGVGAQAFHGKSAGDVIREDLQPGAGPLTSAVNAGIETAAQQADAAMPHPADQPAQSPRAANADMIARIRQLDPEAQQEALRLHDLGNRMDVAPGVRRYAQNRLDAVMGDGQALNPPEKDEKTGKPVAPETPTVADPKMGDANDQSLARVESTMRAEEATAAEAAAAAEKEAKKAKAKKSEPAEPPVDVSAAPELTPQDAMAQREADRSATPTGEPLPADILNKQGRPFRSMAAAMLAKKTAGDGHEIVRVRDGLVVRKAAVTPDAEAPKAASESVAAAPVAPAPVPMPGAAAASGTVGPAPIAVRPAGTAGFSAKDVVKAPAAAPLADVSTEPGKLNTSAEPVQETPETEQVPSDAAPLAVAESAQPPAQEVAPAATDILGQTEEQRRVSIDAETMEDRPDAPEVAQPTKGKRVKVFARTLNGVNDITAHLYEIPGHKGPQLAVKEYKTSRGPGYRVYLPKSGAFITDNNGVSNLEDTLKHAVLRIQHARSTLAAKGKRAQAVTAEPAVAPNEAAVPADATVLNEIEAAGAGTRAEKLGALRTDAQYKLDQALRAPNSNKRDHAEEVSALHARIAALDATKPAADEADARDIRDEAQRGMLKGARQELDAAVKSGAMTEAQARDATEKAKAAGNSADASEAVLKAVDQAATGEEAPAARPARPEELIELRKRASVLESLKLCLAA